MLVLVLARIVAMKLKASETAHRVETAQHLPGGHDASGHGPSIPAHDRRTAALIAVFAAILALIELGSNSSQNQFIAKNVETADLWAFFQAKTIRKTVLQAEKELLERLTVGSFDASLVEHIKDLESDIDRYDNEPVDGRQDLMKRAREAEQARSAALRIFDQFEFSAAFLQFAIVLASLSIITGRRLFVRAGISLAIVGMLFAGIAGIQGFQAQIFYLPAP